MVDWFTMNKKFGLSIIFFKYDLVHDTLYVFVGSRAIKCGISITNQVCLQYTGIYNQV